MAYQTKGLPHQSDAAARRTPVNAQTAQTRQQRETKPARRGTAALKTAHKGQQHLRRPCSKQEMQSSPNCQM